MEDNESARRCIKCLKVKYTYTCFKSITSRKRNYRYYSKTCKKCSSIKKEKTKSNIEDSLSNFKLIIYV